MPRAPGAGPSSDHDTRASPTSGGRTRRATRQRPRSERSGRRRPDRRSGVRHSIPLRTRSRDAHPANLRTVNPRRREPCSWVDALLLQSRIGAASVGDAPAPAGRPERSPAVASCALLLCDGSSHPCKPRPLRGMRSYVRRRASGQTEADAPSGALRRPREKAARTLHVVLVAGSRFAHASLEQRGAADADQ
jgi:hypothetical protein